MTFQQTAAEATRPAGQGRTVQRRYVFLRQFVQTARFLATGAFAAGLNAFLLWILTWLGMWYLTASALAFLLSIGCNFLLQRFWTFRSASRNAIGDQVVLFVALNLFNLALNTALVYGLVERLGVWIVLSQFVSSAAIAGESYCAYRWIFQAGTASDNA